MSDKTAEQVKALNEVAVEALRQSHLLEAALRLPANEQGLVAGSVALDLRALHDRLIQLEEAVEGEQSADERQANRLMRELHERATELRLEQQRTHDGNAEHVVQMEGLGPMRPAEPEAPALINATAEDVAQALVRHLTDQRRVFAESLVEALQRGGLSVVKAKQGI
jgi:DNA-binding ferritin-like protein